MRTGLATARARLESPSALQRRTQQVFVLHRAPVLNRQKVRMFGEKYLSIVLIHGQKAQEFFWENIVVIHIKPGFLAHFVFVVTRLR